MDCSNVTVPFSEHTFAMAELGIYVFATGGFAVFGVFSNVINIVVFYRQGILSSSSTTNLTGLAISDFLNCVLTVFSAVCLFIMHCIVPDPFMSTAYSYSLLLSARPLEITIHTTCWITAFTAFERVFCVVFPFKVKSVFTPKRSLFVIVAIFVGTFVLCIPMTFEFYLKTTVNPETNETFFDISNSGLISPMLMTVYTYTNPFALRFLAIFIVAICNIVLFWKINLSQKFRKTAGAGHLATESSKGTEETPVQTKEAKLLRMITVVSLVFTICYSTFVVFNILYWLVGRLCVDIHYYEQYLAWDITNFFQIVNSSTNIFIYYTMSSRFKEEFDCLWMKIRRNKYL